MPIKKAFEKARWPESEKELVPVEFCSMAADVEAFDRSHKCIDLALKYCPLLAEAVEKVLPMLHAHEHKAPHLPCRCREMLEVYYALTRELEGLE